LYEAAYLIDSSVANAHASFSVTEQVQQKLVERGYGPGPVDGVMGRKIRAAIEKFQSDSGIDATASGYALITNVFQVKDWSSW
jgi:peptidoglycan hydrolase-like protein with peptidoglycan-binding domain